MFFSVGLIVIVGTDQTRNDEITYADPTFFKQKAQKPVREFITVSLMHIYSTIMFMSHNHPSLLPSVIIKTTIMTIIPNNNNNNTYYYYYYNKNYNNCYFY